MIESPVRFDVEVVGNGEHRQQSFAYVREFLAVLTAVYMPGKIPRIISFRPANSSER